MSSLKKGIKRREVRLTIDSFDGGLNTKESANKLELNESPDCKNVVFDDQGAVSTRDGTAYRNTTTIGSGPIDGQASYNGSHVVWCNGSMYHLVGSAPTIVTAASLQFASGVNVASVVYQNILFCSDGTNGPYRYEGPDDFYNMGIGVPSACTGSGTSAGSVTDGDYQYKVSFVNSHAVEGEAGSACGTITIAATATIGLEDIPVGSGLDGVSQRKIYRSKDGGRYGYIATINDNTTTTYADTISNGDEGEEPYDDRTAPTPFNTITELRDRLFFDDSSNRTLLRYTEYTNPFVSEAGNFISIQRGDGSNILVCAVQDGYLVTGKDKSIWALDLADPSNDTTWSLVKTPANIGFAGSKAWCYVPDGLMFLGKRDEKLTGFHLLSGLQVAETADDKLRTRSISEKIESTVQNWPSALWDEIAMLSFGNEVYVACPDSSSSTSMDGMFWFDINRLGSDGQPGSWAPWDGIEVKNLVVHDGVLYGGCSGDIGRIIKFNSGAYSDADGSAINSYWWSKEYGGEEALEYWIKDGRWIHVWIGCYSSSKMDVKWRRDGDTGTGTPKEIDNDTGGAKWNAEQWGSYTWGGGVTTTNYEIPIGAITGRRFQIGFTNKNTVGYAFKVLQARLFMNLRRQR